MKLKDKVALISGASRGLGKAIALSYAREGANIIICARDKASLEAVRQQITQSSRDCLAIVTDISNPADVERLVKQSLSRFQKIDILVNNASLLGPRVDVVNYSFDDWKNVINVNLNGVFLMAKELLKIMIDQKNGSIINMSSSVGRQGRARWGAYAISKFGVEGFTQVLADEVKPYNVRVNAVNPGAMATEMRRRAYPEEDQSKLTKPEEIQDVFLYLASDDSKTITGKSFDAQTFVYPR